MKSNWKMFMKNFFKHKNLIDFSNFSNDSNFYDNQNEMVVDKMKDQCRGIPTNKFAELKSEMHSMLLDDRKESNTTKGVNIATGFNEFSDTLFNKKIVRSKMKRTQSKNTNWEHREINKISLSCFDDKRFVLNDGIDTSAYFHKDLRK